MEDEDVHELGEMDQEIVTKLQQVCVADAFDGMSYHWKTHNLGFDAGPLAK